MDPTNVDEVARTREERQRRERLSRDTEEGDIRWLMNSRRGRRIMRRILDRAGVFNISFNENALITAFNEGRRNEGLYQTNLINRVCPQSFLLMIQEREDARPHNDHTEHDVTG